jgi:hypothetical protein
MLIIAIIASVIAFNSGRLLEQGYIKINNQLTEVVFPGEYFLVLGNIAQEETKVEVVLSNDFILITTYDDGNNVIREYRLVVRLVEGVFDVSNVRSEIPGELNLIDEMSDYLFYIDLEEREYEFLITETERNILEEQIDLVLVNIPEHIYNMKNLTEGVSFTTLVFAVISFLTILGIAYIKRE